MRGKIKKELASSLKRISLFLSAVFGLIGFLGLVGWKFDIFFFKAVFQSLPVVAPNTSFLFILASLAIWFIAFGKKRRPLFIAGNIFAVIISLFGIATLAEYVFGIDLGIDKTLFFLVKSGDVPVRMSPQSAFNFFMLGLSLFFVSQIKIKKMQFGQLLVFVTGELALLSLFGYIYEVSSFYTLMPFKGMAVHTAFSFFLAFVAVLTIHPDVGLMRVFVLRSISGMAARQLLSVLSLVILLEILVTIGRRLNFYDNNLESIIHLLIVASAFLYLILNSLRNLDRLSEMETSIAQMREIDRAKTEFVSLASHQLRTPLTSVSWYTEMLVSGEAGPVNEKQKQYLEEIYIGNRRMLDLVEDFLNTSRIDLGSLEMNPEPLDIKAMCLSVLKELTPIAKNKNIELNHDFSQDLSKIESDPELLRVIFQNLLSNAIKYTPSRGRVSVSIESKKNGILIKVTDTGYGIPLRQKNKIFTKLFRADNVRSKETDGSGLGLYIVKAIVNQSGGKIWFDSVEKKGTTFWVSLPVIIKKRK